jgi:hypothetical protein
MDYKIFILIIVFLTVCDDLQNSNYWYQSQWYGHCLNSTGTPVYTYMTEKLKLVYVITCAVCYN